MTAGNGLNIFLNRFEKGLRQKIEDSDIPFLGLYSNAFKSSQNFVVKKLQIVMAEEERLNYFCECLYRWPALFGSFLANCLQEHYGKEKGFSIYPLLEKELGTPIKGKGRSQLYLAFSRACEKLGLTYETKAESIFYMAETYLRQAGIPMVYVPDLTRAMLRFSELNGIPLADDDDAVISWQRHFSEIKLNGYSKFVFEALAKDEDAYYSRCFLRSLANERNEEVEKANETYFSQELENILDAQDTKVIEKLAKEPSLPRFIWKDDDYGIFLPVRNKESWTLEIENHEKMRMEPQRDGSFVPLTEEIFTKVKVSSEKNDVCWEKLIWENHKNNQFLVFPERGGEWITNGSLQRYDSDIAVRLNPGLYTVLSRFEPENGVDTWEVCPEPSLFATNICLKAGNKEELKYYGAVARFQCKEKPELAFDGSLYQGIEGRSFIMGADLAINIDLPKSLKEELSCGWFIQLKLVSKSECVKIPIEDINLNHFELHQKLDAYSDGLRLVVAELRHEGRKRAYARASAYVWIGLQEVDQRVIFKGSAKNLNLDLSENLKDENGLITFQDRDQKYFRMVFDLGNGRTIAFRFSIPGLFLSLIERAMTATPEIEKFIPIGSSLSITHTSSQKLRVYFNQEGLLKLGDYEVEPRFSQKGFINLPLSTLTDYIKPGTHELELHTGDDKQSLISLATPHQVQDFAIQQNPKTLDISFALLQPATKLRLEIVELLSGQINIQHLVANDLDVFTRDEQKVEFIVNSRSTHSGVCRHELIVHGNTFQNGLYLIKSEFEVQNRWGNLTNARLDTYAVGLVKCDSGSLSYKNAYRISSRSMSADIGLIIKRFNRIHEVLSMCHAIECWDSISWIKELWFEHLNILKFIKLSDEGLCQFLRTTMQQGGNAENESWFPLLNAGAVCPEMFARPIQTYLKIPEKESKPVFGKVLKNLRDLGLFSQKSWLSLAYSRDLEPGFWSGFQNFFEVQSGQDTFRDFSLERYQNAIASRDLEDLWFWLKKEQWAPGCGHYLDPLHLRYVQTKMLDNFYAAKEGYFNLRAEAFHLARWFVRSIDSGFNFGLDGELGEKHWLTGVGDMVNTRLDSGNLEHDEEALRACRRLLACFAKACRLEPRRPNSLKYFFDFLEKGPGNSSVTIRQNLGHLLYMGYDLFGYYLMLWELIFRFDLDGGNND